ncbi:MAG: YccF domain-containing protein [Exilibacterium sp.]
MDLLRLLANILWLLLGGLSMCLAWWFFGILAVVTIIGIPFARACFVIGLLALWPFGKDTVSRQLVNDYDDIGTGPLGLIGNVIWFVCAGFWLAIGHLIHALVFVITIIGIPFALQHLKLAKLSVFPIGQTIVDID